MSREGKRTHLMFLALALPNREGRITSPVIGTGREKDLFTRFSCIRHTGAKGVLSGAASLPWGLHHTPCTPVSSSAGGRKARREVLVPGKEGQVRVSLSARACRRGSQRPHDRVKGSKGCHQRRRRKTTSHFSRPTRGSQGALVTYPFPLPPLARRCNRRCPKETEISARAEISSPY